MKKPIDPNLNNFADGLEDILDDGSFKLNDNESDQRKSNGELEIKIKENHYSGAEHHHHSSHSHSDHHSSHEHHSSHSHGEHRSSSHHHSSHESHSSSSKSKSKKEKKKLPIAARIAIAILIIILFLIFSVIGSFFILEHMGKSDLKNVTTETDFKETLEYNGHTYSYNDDMMAVAFLGIDKRDLGTVDGAIGTGGQSDTNIVLAIDSNTGKTTAIAIPRDTIAEVDLYSNSGLFLRSEEMQLCLSYAYGDGKASSAANTVTSISRVLGNVPISKYFSLDLDGIAALNDAIGGVTLESLYDFDNLGIHKGDTIHLEGDMTETYVRQRSLDDINASLNRTERQIQYIRAFAGQLIPAAIDDFSVVSRLYNTATNYSSTDVTLSNTTYLASLILSKNIRDFDTITLKGEMKPSDRVDENGNVYAEFHPDKDALMETIISVFYTQVD
ncbi:MAG: LCP family protein [Eubacterium sp.]|nr:LCP family protein [Eubacterium sp.]